MFGAAGALPDLLLAGRLAESSAGYAVVRALSGFALQSGLAGTAADAGGYI